MIYSSNRFTLDIQRLHSQVSVPVSQGDTAKSFYISLRDGGEPYFITAGCLAMLSIKRPSGSFMQAFCTVLDNTVIKYDFSENEYSATEEGVHDCELTLFDPDGGQLSSSWFTMVVNARVINSDNINVSDEDRDAVDAILGAEASRQAAETGRVNAEASRVNSEGVRVNAEIARTSAFDEAVSESNEAAARANQIAEILEKKLANGEFNGADGGDFNTAGLTVDCEIDPSTYVMTVAIKDATGNVLSSDTVDLPLESVVVGGDEEGGIVTLTLQNGNTISFDISDLVDGLVSQAKHDEDIAALSARIDELAEGGVSSAVLTEIDTLIGEGV